MSSYAKHLMSLWSLSEQLSRAVLPIKYLLFDMAKLTEKILFYYIYIFFNANVELCLFSFSQNC